MKVILIACVFVLFANLTRVSGYGLINGGHYRILTMEDGLYITAAYPTFEEGVNLGEISTEKWVNSREQRWDVHAFDKSRNEYWIFSQENTFNRLTAAYNGNRPTKHISELIPVDKHRYLIRSTLRDACLVNPGLGEKIIYAICNLDAKNQHWELDLLSKQ